MTESENVVVLKGVKKDYNTKAAAGVVSALRGVDMTIKRGTMVAIKGPSGSGKTTLLQMIGALDLPTSGSVEVNGKDITELPEKELTEYRAKTIGFVFQSYNLIPNLTAVENVELPMEAMNVPPKKRRGRALELLDIVGMKERINYKPHKLSGGEAQRVAIARALANKPSIILADEPTGNLDSKTGDGIIKLMSQLKEGEGTTIVIVTHSDVIPKMCDLTFTIKDGKITSEQDVKKMSEIEDQKKVLRISLSASDKIVDKLVEAGFLDIDSLASASPDEIGKILGDKNKGVRITNKAKLLKQNEEEIT